MSLTKVLALLALTAGSMTSMACGEDGASSTATTGGGAACKPHPVFDYHNCGNSSFFPDGTCLAGECATVPLEARVFKEWRAQVKALTGFTDAELDARVQVSGMSHSDGPEEVTVFIHYVIILDWIRSIQSASPTLGNSPLAMPPTDAEIKDAVTLAVGSDTWTRVAAIKQVAPESATRAAFDACTCGMSIGYCSIGFDSPSGNLLVGGSRDNNPSENVCQEAVVDVERGKLDQCYDRNPCWIN